MPDKDRVQRTILMMAEFGMVTIKGPVTDEGSVVKINQDCPHDTFEAALDDFIKRYPVTLAYLRGDHS